MSYDLGNWADKLTCELCDGEFDDEIDLDVPDDFYDDYDPWDDPGWYDYDDPEDEGGLFDDFEVPGVDLPGGGRATPGWDDGPRGEFEWEF